MDRMMCLILMVAFLVHGSMTVLTNSTNRPPENPSSSYRDCLYQTDSKLNLFEVLPGGGWDNLMNKDRGFVLDISYSQCKTTEDRKYLLPDFVNTVPNKVSEISTFAKLFTHWSQYKSATSSSVNTDVGLVFEEGKVSGSFGDDHRRVKETQIQFTSYTSQVQLRYNRYKAELQPGFPLHPTFKSRLLTIAKNLRLNRIQEARFESQLLVREYGTHVITQIDAGAILAKEDSIDKSFVKSTDYTASQISSAASATFFGLAKFDTSYTHSVSDTIVQGYTSHTTTSKVFSYGGPVFKTSNYTPDEWLNGIDNNLVAVDRSGDPIHFYITTTARPELSASTVYLLRRYIGDAVAEYYKFNTYRGCTDPDSPNFSLAANLDDGSCKKNFSKVHFGGVFQTCNMTDLNSGNICSDEKLEQTNPLTGDYSCPANFQPVPVTSGAVDKQWVEHSCHKCWLLFKCCHDISHTSRATYEGFWCSAITPETGLFFGGLFTSKVSNPFTSAQSCPDYYNELHIGTDLSICVSDDGDLGPLSSVPLGGFFSCRTGNPLALTASKSSQKSANQNQWPKQCPPGYSIHVATSDQGCPINYCLVSEAFKNVELRIVRRPPYMKSPVIPRPDHVFSLFDSVSNKWMMNSEAFDFIRSNIPKAANLTSSEIMMSPVFPQVDPSPQKLMETDSALNNLQGGSVDIRRKADESLSGGSFELHPSNRNKYKNEKSVMVVQGDAKHERKPKAGEAGSSWVVVGSIVVGVGFFLVITALLVIRLRRRRRGDYHSLGTRDTQ